MDISCWDLYEKRSAEEKDYREYVERAKLRGRLFVLLYAAAKQLTDNHPKHFPYLEATVLEIEKASLVPPLIRG